MRFYTPHMHRYATLLTISSSAIMEIKVFLACLAAVLSLVGARYEYIQTTANKCLPYHSIIYF